MKKSVTFLSVLLFVTVFFFWAANPTWAQAKKYILIGSTSTGSSHYSYAVAATKVINQYVPEVNANVVETGGAVDNLKRMQAGQIDIGACVSSTAAYEAWKGIGLWKEKQMPDLRLLWVYDVAINFFVVREDSGVKRLEDLEGKKFNPGKTGGSDEVLNKRIFEILGIKPNYYAGGTTDVVGAIKDGRIVGFAKYGIGVQLDAASLDIMTMTKVRLIQMTPEQVQKVKNAIPYVSFLKVPTGQIKAMPSLPEYTNWGAVIYTNAMKSFPDDLAYRCVKAIVKGRDMIIAAYPAHAAVNVPVDTPEKALMPLHAGAYRAYKEMGVKIPESAIPPEVKSR